MDPPTPIETLAQSLDAVFPMNYPIFEGDEVSEALTDYFDVSSVEDEVPVKRQKEKNYNDLTKATSEILSKYRAFLNEHETDEEDKDDEDDEDDEEDEETGSRGSDPPEDGFRELHYYAHRNKSLASSNHGGRALSRSDLSVASSGSGGTTCLLRDFSMPQVPLGSSDDGLEGGRKSEMPPVLRSKRVKFGVFMSMGLIVVIVLVIGISANGSKSKMPKKDNTPGWHSAAAYILEHENGDMTQKLPHYTVQVPRKDEQEPMSIEDLPASQIMEPIVENVFLAKSHEEELEYKPEQEESVAEVLLAKSHEEELEYKPEQEESVTEAKAEAEGEVEVEGESNSAPKNTETLAETGSVHDIKSTPAVRETSTANEAATSVETSFDLGKILHDRFKPLWLSSREGWNGGSHAEAMQFCKTIRGKELCPYSAVCPYGPGRSVMPGRRPVDFSVHGEQYAPVYGHANRWVMVGQKNGDPSTTCKNHEQLESRPPRWGLNADRPELKQHIMCCTMPAA